MLRSYIFSIYVTSNKQTHKIWKKISEICFGKYTQFWRNPKKWAYFCKLSLKRMSAIFYQMFTFSQNDSLLKTMKNVFSSKKLFSFSRYSIFFPPSFPHLLDSKWQMEVEQFMMSWTGLHKFEDVVFGITQKLLYITSSNLVR